MPGDMLHWARKAEESLKVFFSPGLLFEALNFRYVGPIQGHRMDVVLETFENVKEMLANGRRARCWCTPSPRRGTATSPPSATRSSTTA